VKIEAWKKIFTITGLLTLEVGHLMESQILIIIGLILSIVGTLLMFIFKK